MKTCLALLFLTLSAAGAYDCLDATVGTVHNQPAFFWQAVTLYNAQGENCLCDGSNCLRPGPVRIIAYDPEPNGGITVASCFPVGDFSFFAQTETPYEHHCGLDLERAKVFIPISTYQNWWWHDDMRKLLDHGAMLIF